LSSGRLENCEIQGSIGGFVVTGPNAFHISENRISGQWYSLYLDSNPGGTIVEGNTLEGGDWFTIGVFANDSVPTIINNDIIKGQGPAVTLESALMGNDLEVDLTNNYWGTTDAETIAEWIIDGNDDPSIHLFGIFEPFAGGSVPSQSMTLDALKALYRGERN